MPVYRYRTVDLKTNLVLGDLDLTGVHFEITMSEPGELRASLYVPDSGTGYLYDEATTPGRTGLYVLRNETPVWGGIVWDRDWDEEENTYDLRCLSWESYAYHVVQTSTKKYVNTDQLTIGRELITQSIIEIDSGIEPPPTDLSGRLRDRNMFAYERKTVGLELEQLAGLEDGFDYRVESYIKGDGSLGRRYLFGYPRLGRAINASSPGDSITFDYPGNLRPFKLSEDAKRTGWKVYSVGAGEGNQMLVAQAQDNSFADAGWPTLDVVTTYKDVSLLPTLQNHANQDLKERKPSLDSWSFELNADSDIGFTEIQIGDSAIFRLRSRRWREPYVMERRIAQISVTPPEGENVERIVLGLEDLVEE